MISINSLKIDRSYICQMNEHKEDWAIVKTIIQLAHELNLKVIAEGVEEEYELKSLKEIGCDEIQGYFISKPLPSREFEQLLLHN
ncbi:EAL domain-containing protein [Bacillus sp. P1(2020)]|uniref:EAL domain-containing protein n=1 Tax=Pallidibacillus pasinlerensis TaxID=2703818 RepID=A0ABX0A9A0_9BACI|nr:EAL domain-containing protein [Pallidibacillus pasinlerensis]